MASPQATVPFNSYSGQTPVENPFLPSPTSVMYFFGAIGFCIILFLIGRMFVLWYWKINRIVELLEKIEYNTREPRFQSEPKTAESKNNG